METVRCSFAATCTRSCRDARQAGNAAARRAAARLMPATDPSELRVMRRSHGAPRVESVAIGGLQDAPPRVSITHSGSSAAAAAVPAGWLVGIDMERAGSVDASETRFFLTSRERQELERFDATTLWCLKEAVWKALECAGDVAFKELELRFGADGELYVVRLRDRVWRARARVLRFRDRWIIAVVRIREYVRCPAHGRAI